MEYALAKAEKQEPQAGFTTEQRIRLSREPEAKLFDLDYADHIALLSGTIENPQAQLTVTANTAKEVGLLVNTDKTEAFTNQEHVTQSLTLHGKEIKWVKNFRLTDKIDRDRHRHPQRTSLGCLLERRVQIEKHTTEAQDQHLQSISFSGSSIRVRKLDYDNQNRKQLA
jgi:hypothetical protein